jgi:flavorubredoxin
MYNVKQLTDDLYWIGGNDRRLALFENVYPIPQGVSYNAYLYVGEQTVLMDTVDHAIAGVFFENIAHLLAGRKLDYIVVNHMEPDHCATLQDTVLRYPDAKIICNAKTVTMIKQFFDFDIDSRAVVIKEGDSLEIGGHTLTFVMAPMVHWPEAMVTYDATEKILFSADAFGTFGAVSGSIFADETDFESRQLDEARRYYTNIVGKYGPQVVALLKKAAGLDIQMVCPLHGWVLRGETIGWFIDKYMTWATYAPEEKGVVIAYG